MNITGTLPPNGHLNFEAKLEGQKKIALSIAILAFLSN
jgi:hypothetical protein